MTRYASAATKLGVLSSLLVLAVVGLMVISAASGVIAAPSHQVNGTVVSVQPASQTISVGDTTTVDVQIENVSNLFGVDLRLSFDPSIVRVVDSNPLVPDDQVEPGAFLDISGGKGFIVQNSADNTAGKISYAATLLSPAAPVSGSGQLIRITFEGIAEGTSAVTLESVLLSDSKAEEIPATKQDGSIRVIKEVTPTAPPPTGNVIIKGTVQDCLTGAGVGGATVRVVEAPDASATTDANGNYEIIATLGLPGEYTIEVTQPNYFSPKTKSTGLIEEAGKDLVTVTVNFTGVDCLRPKPTPSPTPTHTPTITPTPTVTPTPTRRKPQTLLILDGAATFCDASEVRDGAVVEIVTPQGGVVSSQPVSHRGEFFFYEDFQGLEGIYWIRFRFLDPNVQYLKDAGGSREFELIDADGDGDIDADDLFVKENTRQLNFVGVNCVQPKPGAPLPPSPYRPPAKPAPYYPPVKPDKQCVHVVRYGETLYSIARRYGTTVWAIAKANSIYNVNYIRPGMKLVIPNCYYPKPYPAYRPPAPGCTTYVVQRGDTLYSIARRYGTSVYALAQANHIVNPWHIRAGAKIVICPKYGFDGYGKYPQQAYKPADHGYKYHVVKLGDTVYSIAMYYGVTPQAIVQRNHLANPHMIWAGQKLRIF
ncbi:MAG: LysM peptidoglycan-binding domain-containing protein [Anaerolineae bacterium]